MMPPIAEYIPNQSSISSAPSAMAPDQRQDNALRQVMQAANKGEYDAGSIIQELADRRNNRQEPQSFLDRMSDGERMLLDMGLAMMVEGGKPGSTLLGAVGAGGQAASRGSRQRKQDKQGRQDKEQDRLLKELLAGAELAKSGVRLNMDKDKFSYQKDRDAVSDDRFDRQMDMRMQQFDYQRGKDYQPNFKTVQDANGNFVLIDTNAMSGTGGQAQPVIGPDGQPIAGQVNDPLRDLMMGVVQDTITNREDWDDTPIDEKVRENLKAVEVLRNPRARSRSAQPPAAAVDFLRNNPNLAAEFERKYGVPAGQFLSQ